MTPHLFQIALKDPSIRPSSFPFDIPAIAKGLPLRFTRQVTFLVGENGTGKSTLLEAIASNCDFNLAGGSRNNKFQVERTTTELASQIRLSWRKRLTSGFFLRAETFFDFASYLDAEAKEDGRAFHSYGGRSLHEQSHGESFLSLFSNRFWNDENIYLLDEPEAALSPARQLAFLSILHQLTRAGHVQFIIATHSPMLLAYPEAEVLQFDERGINPIDYRETEHFTLMRGFLNAPERYFNELFREDS